MDKNKNMFIFKTKISRKAFVINNNDKKWNCKKYFLLWMNYTLIFR